MINKCHARPKRNRKNERYQLWGVSLPLLTEFEYLWVQIDGRVEGLEEFSTFRFSDDATLLNFTGSTALQPSFEARGDLQICGDRLVSASGLFEHTCGDLSARRARSTNTEELDINEWLVVNVKETQRTPQDHHKTARSSTST